MHKVQVLAAYISKYVYTASTVYTVSVMETDKRTLSENNLLPSTHTNV